MPLALFSSRVVKNSLKPHSSSRRSLRRAAGLGLGFLSLLSVSAAHAGPVNWISGSGDWFGSPSNWDNGSTPGAGDDAVNSNAGAAITLGQSTTVNSFFSSGAFSLQGGTFSGNQASSASTLTVNNVFTDDGGQINNFTVNQGVGGSLVFTGSGNNSINNSIINSSMDLATNQGAFVRLYGTDTVNGTISLGTYNTNDGYGLRLSSGGNLIIGSGGALQGFGNVSEENAAGTLTNNGLVNANSSVGNTLTMDQTNFVNNGTAEATNGGILNLNNTTTNSGFVKSTGAGSTVNITGTFTSTGGSTTNLITASGGGVVNINGANLVGMINTDPNTFLVFNGSNNNAINNNNGTNSTTVNGNLDLATNQGAFVRLYGTDTVNGTISLATYNANDGYGLRLSNGADLILNGTLQGFGNVSEENAAGTLTNNGLVNANSSVGNTLTMDQTNFINNGTAEATNGGILNLNNTTTNSGTLNALSGGIVNITGTFTSNAGNTIDGAGGTVNINGASLLGTINEASGTSLVLNGSGNNNLSGTTVNGNLDLATNTGAFVRLYGTDTVNGTISLATYNANDGYGLRLSNGGSLTLGSGSVLQGFGNVSEENAAGTLTNNGTINANSSVGNALTMDQTNFINNGTAEATNGGILALNNTTTNSGFVKSTGAGSTVNITGTFTSTGGNTTNLITSSGGGVVNINGASLLGTINEASGTSLVLNGSGNNNLSGTTVNGNLDLATNVNAFVRLYGTDTVNGTISLATYNANDSYGLRLSNGGNLIIGSGGALQGFGNVSEENAAGTLTNNGLVNANSSVGNTLTMDQTNFVNSSGATAEATGGGILSLNNNTTNDGALTATGAGSSVGITGTFTGGGSNLITASGGGAVDINGASLLGTINTDPNTSLVLNGSGNNNLSGTTVNGNLDLATNVNAFVRLYGTDTVNGTISLATYNANDSYGLRLSNGGNLIIGSGGALQGFGNVSEENAAGTLTNNGLVNANSSVGNALTMDQTNFINNGTTEVQNGAALNVTSANTDSGNILVKTGGTATFTQGVTQTAGLTQADGTLNSPVTLTGGTLAGTGTVVGDVTNTSGTVSAGNSASPFGTLTVNGSFTQGSGGVLDANFSSTQNNLLAVAGAVTTGGVLDVNYLGSGPYTGSGPFTFLDYTTLATSITGTGQTQYFANETFDPTTGDGIIDGSNGFTYELLNDTANNGLQLQVLTNGAPVPEASTTISLGALLLLGGAGLWRAKRRTVTAD